MNIPAIVAAVQRKLNLEDDGIDGPKTWAAIHKAIVGTDWQDKPLPPDNVTIVEGAVGVDARSEAAIQTLLPEVQPYARALLIKAAQQGIKLVVTSATRTYAEQDALFQQGRSKPGKIVTNARAGHSNHDFGIAFDVTIFDGPTPIWESPRYKAVGAIGRALGLTWGGDWTSINDEPHFELKPAWAKTLSEGSMLSMLRTRKEKGQDFFA